MMMVRQSCSSEHCLFLRKPELDVRSLGKEKANDGFVVKQTISKWKIVVIQNSNFDLPLNVYWFVSSYIIISSNIYGTKYVSILVIKIISDKKQL